MAFELDMYDKFAALIGKNAEEFWKMLIEAFQFNRVGYIDMDPWFMHFFKLSEADNSESKTGMT